MDILNVILLVTAIVNLVEAIVELITSLTKRGK